MAGKYGGLTRTFTYSPLPSSTTIRILTLHPGAPASPLTGTLDEADINSQPAYEAISHVWGSSKRDRPFQCRYRRDDGSTPAQWAVLPVTQSIHDALVRMRHPSQPRRLWADQICIDQANLAERGEQVSLMNAIYHNAQRVLVWLGVDEEGIADKAVNMIHHLKMVFDDKDQHDDFRKQHSDNLAQQSELPWIPLSKMSKLPWFKRIWIVQEIGTSTPATLFWGSASVDWEIVSYVVSVLNQHYHHLRTRFTIYTPSIRYLYKRFVVSPGEQYDENSNKWSFVHELHRAKHLQSTDPRDHVYAFLGHFSIHAGKEWLARLRADYTLTVEQVYTDVAVRELKDARSLVLLSTCQPSPPSVMNQLKAQGQDPLPSWVPDWRVTPRHLIGSPESPHAAAGNTLPSMTIDEPNKLLHIKGVKVDTLTVVSWTFWGKGFLFRTSSSLSAASSQPGENDDPATASQEVHKRPARDNDLTGLTATWNSVLGFGTFNLTQPYRAGSDDSALFAVMQTLTSGCAGSARTRPYEKITKDRWLANGAAFLVRTHDVSLSDSRSPAKRKREDSWPVGEDRTQHRPAENEEVVAGGCKVTSLQQDGIKPTDPYTELEPASRQGSQGTGVPVVIDPELREIAKTGDPFQWSHEATLVTRYRRFAVTEKGYYVMGPASLETGDTIAVLYGGKTPFILRELQDGSYQFLGECYVHGLMNGEALNSGIDQVFTLR